MRKDIRIPAGVVRATVGALAVALVAFTVFETPEIVRYYKLKTM
ncbi:hypothetical protein [Streptomyces sp.]